MSVFEDFNKKGAKKKISNPITDLAPFQGDPDNPVRPDGTLGSGRPKKHPPGTPQGSAPIKHTYRDEPGHRLFGKYVGTFEISDARPSDVDFPYSSGTRDVEAFRNAEEFRKKAEEDWMLFYSDPIAYWTRILDTYPEGEGTGWGRQFVLKRLNEVSI